MNEFETADFSNESSEKEILKNSADYLEYCDVCFIALGSQEKRIYMDKNVAHLDCAKKSRTKINTA
jgi:hypothetical protein